MPHKKQANFEILKVIAMLMVVTVHYWPYCTGYWYAPIMESARWDCPVTIVNYILIQNFLNIFHCCIPIFILISGYFLSTKGWTFNLRRNGLLWLYAFLYGTLLCCLFYSPPDNDKELINTILYVLPLSGNRYWFISCYLALAAVAPFLSILSQRLSRGQFHALLLVGFIFGVSIWKFFPFGNAIGANYGFSLISFIFLFFVGAYIRKYDLSLKGKRPGLLLGAFILLAFLLDCGKDLLTGKPLYIKTSYYNDLNVFIAIIFFVMAKDWKVQDSKASRFLCRLTPYLFGVYLIHDNIYFRGPMWNLVNKVFPFSFTHASAFPYFLLCPTLVFIACLGLDFAFKSFCRIIGLEALFGRWMDRLHDKFSPVFSSQS